MGKKESWFSAIKRVFLPRSKEKLVNGSEKKKTKEKKKGRGILRHGETKSFIPLFREPSSIEKILGEAEQQKLLIRPSTPSEQPKTPPLVLPRAASPRVASPRVASPRVASPRVSSQRKDISYRPEPTIRYRHLSATKIQAAYRGYMARRSVRALRGLVRLQGVVRSQNVKRQTMSAMKYMQLLVRVQTQIQSRRIQMLENQVLHRQAYKNDKELESSLGKWTMSQSEAGRLEEWDDSRLTKEEIEARLQRKVEAAIKRDRAMAYAYSNQLWRTNPKSAQTALMDVQSSGFPWWWNWLERRLPPANPSESQAMKNVHLTPPRLTFEPKPSPQSATSNYKQHNFGFDNPETPTPRSSRSMAPVRTRQFYTSSNRTPPMHSSGLMKYSKPRTSTANSAFDGSLKDDDSLMSCPPFSVPNYMAPTVSAKAKVRANSNPKDRFPGTPGSTESKRRFSFPLTPNLGSFKWNKVSSKDSTSQKALEKHTPLHSIGDLSVDSITSMPAAVGRKPFNRFV